MDRAEKLASLKGLILKKKEKFASSIINNLDFTSSISKPSLYYMRFTDKQKKQWLLVVHARNNVIINLVNALYYALN